MQAELEAGWEAGEAGEAGEVAAREVAGSAEARAWLSPKQAHALAQRKVRYICACQVYGDYVRSGDTRASDIELLLHMVRPIPIPIPSSNTIPSPSPDTNPNPDPNPSPNPNPNPNQHPNPSPNPNPNPNQYPNPSPNPNPNPNQYPSLRVAYIERTSQPAGGMASPSAIGRSGSAPRSTPHEHEAAGGMGGAAEQPAADSEHGPNGTEYWYAVLVRSDGDGGVLEESRLRLPGNPILGEGKPENQNAALPFTRGEKIMMIDMNQEGYF